MKKRILALITGLLCASAAMAASGGGWSVADSVLARVDDSIITSSLLRGERALLEVEEGQSKLPDVEFLRRLIRRRLVVAEAGKLRMAVSEEDISPLMADLREKAGGEAALSALASSIGMTADDLERRASEKALVKKFLELKRASVYVPESEVRSFIAQNPAVSGDRPLAKVRDEVRELLATRKYQEELDKWIDRQISQGRVRITPVSE